MVRILFLKRFNNLSDEQAEYQLLDRMSSMSSRLRSKFWVNLTTDFLATVTALTVRRRGGA